MTTKSEHAQYLQGEHWQRRRKEYLAKNRFCRRCDLPRSLAAIAYDQDLHVHHKSYLNIGQEPDEDLESLCRRCHEIVTFGRSELREIRKHRCPLCGYDSFDPQGGICSGCEFLVYVGPDRELLRKDDPVLPSIKPLGQIKIWHRVLVLIMAAVSKDEFYAALRHMEKNQKHWKEVA